MTWFKKLGGWLWAIGGAALAILLLLVGRRGGVRRAKINRLKDETSDTDSDIDQAEDDLEQALEGEAIIREENERQAAERVAAREERQADVEADPSAGGSARRMRDLLRRRRS